MKRYLIKTILLIIVILLLLCNCKVFANEYEEVQELYKIAAKDPFSDPGYFEPKPEDSEAVLLEKAGKLLGGINVIGVVVSVVMLVAIGLKYMIGSIEEKAEYKKSLLPYVIGAILVFATTSIPNIIYNFTDSLLKINN